MPQLTQPVGALGAVVHVALRPSTRLHRTLQAAGKLPPTAIEGLAIVDTGANRTCVDRSVVSALGLVPLGVSRVRTPSTGDAPTSGRQFEVALLLQTSVPGESPLEVDPLEVVALDLVAWQGVHAILGRDVLERCLLVYHGPEEQFTLAY